jgi:HlyD family secretion protein
MDAEGDIRKVEQQLIKQRHKGELLELRAPQAGIVKDLATHTVGTVVQPGTVLLSLVPENEPLIAEVTVRNDDVGFVFAKQPVKLKVAPYPFEQYGLIDGTVSVVEPDSDNQADNGKSANAKSGNDKSDDEQQHSGYKALVALNEQTLVAQGKSYPLVPGMQVTAEINQGSRTVMEYLLSPVARTLHDSGRER